MARRNPRREQLLAEVSKAHRYAGQKVSRLERRNDIRIRDNGLDPRRDYTAMSTAQLARYSAQLAAFNSRATGFVRGEEGAPISAASWRRYRRAEQANNALVEKYNAHLQAIGEVPGLGRTPAQYNADREGIDRTRARGQWRTFEKIEREAGDIEGESAIGKLTRAMEKRIDPKYLADRMRQERANIKKMLESTGDVGEGSLWNRIRNMPNEQLALLVDNTDFMNRASGKYVFAKARNEDTPEWQSEVADEYSAGMDELVTWVRKQPRVSPSKAAAPVEGDGTKSSGSSRGNSNQRWTDRNTNAGPIPTQFDPNDTRVRSNPVVGDRKKPKRRDR